VQDQETRHAFRNAVNNALTCTKLLLHRGKEENQYLSTDVVMWTNLPGSYPKELVNAKKHRSGQGEGMPVQLSRIRGPVED